MKNNTITEKPFPDAEEIEKIFQRAVQRALLIHKRMNNYIVIMENGKMVTIPPEKIQVEEPPSDEILQLPMF